MQSLFSFKTKPDWKGQTYPVGDFDEISAKFIRSTKRTLTVSINGTHIKMSSTDKNSGRFYQVIVNHTVYNFQGYSHMNVKDEYHLLVRAERFSLLNKHSPKIGQLFQFVVSKDFAYELSANIIHVKTKTTEHNNLLILGVKTEGPHDIMVYCRNYKHRYISPPVHVTMFYAINEY